ncbi:MAG: PIN domain-containing protein [Methylococcaceae bacterium]|nr:PIN domain-containing protein [Methylococcaceae bacterium]
MSVEFVDTNIVIYSLSEEAAKRRKALSILARKPFVSIQVLNETANIMRRKLAFDIPAIRQFLMDLMKESRVHPITPVTVLSALAAAERYGFSHYDSVIVATALDAGCSMLYSEDMQHEQIIDNRLTIINPFR